MTALDRLRQEEVGTRHAAAVSIRIGTRTAFDAGVTTPGLLSVAALMSSILLCTAVIVLAAGRKDSRRSQVKPSASGGS